VVHDSAVLNSLPVNPSLGVFRPLAEQGNVVPVYAQLAADFRIKGQDKGGGGLSSLGRNGIDASKRASQ